MLRQALQGAGELMLSPAALVCDSFRQRQVLQEASHRPWPIPDEPWVMGQTWLDLLFCHWPVRLEDLEAVVPGELQIDTYDGSAWLGITPFLVRGLRLRGTPPVPLASAFAEINVRTYVTVGGRPGIYFLSLDADSRSAVHAARRWYRLPYFRSSISVSAREGQVAFEATRVSSDGPSARFAATYGPAGEAATAAPGSLEEWLTERYCLYTLDQHRRVHRGEIHHPPWPLRSARADLQHNTMAAPHGIALPGEPLLHLSGRQDVALWPIRPVAPA